MILLVGPTGETARRIIRYAEEAGVTLRLGARDVQSARARLGPLGAGFEMRRVDASDQSSAETALESRDVLLNATTPAGAHGHILARAAIHAGAHYTAFTGEVIDTWKLLRELDEPARKRNVTLCPGAGSSGALSGLATCLALQSLPDATDGITGSSINGFVPSRGTLISEMSIMNGPGIVIRGGELVQEETAGRIIRCDGVFIVERPLIDPMMIWTLGKFRSFRSGIEILETAVESSSAMFKATSEQMRSEEGRAAYFNLIATIGNDVQECDTEGTMRAILSNGARSFAAMITTRPVYEVTARAVLLVSRALDGSSDKPAGFQGASKLIESLEQALSELRSRIVIP